MKKSFLLFCFFVLFVTNKLCSQQNAPACTLTCQGLVNVSLSATYCDKELVPSDVLTAGSAAVCPDVFVEVIPPFGIKLPESFINSSIIGYTVVYKVIDPATGNSCWGYLKAEDKSGPTVPCKNVTISCFQLDQINKIAQETVDACHPEGSSVVLKTTWKDYGCDSATVLGRVYRDILAKDIWGNVSPCSDTLTIRKDTLGSVCCPSMINLPCRLYCLNGAKILREIEKNPTGIGVILNILNVKNYDLYQLSPVKSSPMYPTPELLLKIQGKGDPLVELGATQGRVSGTKLLFENLVIPNFNSFCISPDSLVVPYLYDSILDTKKYLYDLDLDVDEDGNLTYNLQKSPNPNYCKQYKGKTAMYGALGGVCKLTVGYTDEILPICGNGFKLRRQWRITDWCTGKEKICIQYITVEDKLDPNVLISGRPDAIGPITKIVTGIKDTIAYFRAVKPHDCYADVNIARLNVWDCSNVDEQVYFEYQDPQNPGKVILQTGKLGANGYNIKLPQGLYFGKVSLIDECLNTCNFPIFAAIEDMTPPNPVCDEITQTTVDPATCWARVYAKDLDNGSKDNCCNTLHFGVALMDSVDYYRKAYTDHIIKICGWQKYADAKFVFDFIVNEYLSLYVFKDYVDLTECGTNQVVLRVFDNCKSARYDDHVTRLTLHQWNMAQIYGLYPIFLGLDDPDYTYLRFVENVILKTPSQFLQYLKDSVNTEQKCLDQTELKFAALLNQFFKQFVPSLIDTLNTDILIDVFKGIGSGDFCIPEFKVAIPFDEAAIMDFAKNVQDAVTIQQVQQRLEAFILALCQSISNDCMVQVLVDDKTPPVCETPPNLFWYCDNVATSEENIFEYADNACTARNNSTYPNYKCTFGDGSGTPYNEIELIKENDGDLSDTLDGTKSKFYGYYGCQSQSGHPAEEHGEISTPCQNNWAPIYCRTWLLLDKNDQAGKVDVRNAFYTPVGRSGGRGADVVTGQFIIWDNCWLGSITSADDHYVDQCGNGWWQRTWTAKDKCGASISCSQKIYTKHRTDFEVMFPQDLVLNCDANAGTSPDGQAGRPMIMDDECELVGVSYDDVRFDIVPDACYKIVRTWKLIDWCKYDPNQHNRKTDVIVDDRFVANAETRGCIYRKLKDDGDGYMTYTQIIKVIDTKRPTIVCPKNDTLCINDGYAGKGDEVDPMCVVPSYSSADFKATDNCAQPSEISFRYEVSTDQKSWTKSAPNKTRFTSNSLGEGLTYVRVIAEDNCSQEDTCVFTILVRDCKKPTPYCYNGIATVIMPTSGSVTVWATDLNAGSYDNCTKKKDLSFAFDKDFKNPSQNFTCGDVPNGVSATVTVNIYVKDKAGNVDNCNTYLLIQDGSGNVCPDQAGVNSSIAGRTMMETKDPIENVTVELKNAGKSISFNTDISGKYSFSNLPLNSDYSIVPFKDDDPRNGISTIDLVLIQKHVLGTELLKSPYNMIAADADKSNDITVLDILELRKLILGVYDKLPNTSSWRFMPINYQFSDPSHPWTFPDQIDIAHLSKDEMTNDFVGIKVGDVNGTVTPHKLLGTEFRQGGSPLKFSILDASLKAGEETTLHFTSTDFANIEGFQFTMNFADLKLMDIIPGKLNINQANFGLRRMNQGLITASWNDSKGITANQDEVLFSLKVKALKDIVLSKQLSINSKLTIAEAYENNVVKNVALTFGNKSSNYSFKLDQNTPNPFVSSTLINYELPFDMKALLKVTDVTGKLIKEYSLDGSKGIHQLIIAKSDIKATGVLYYTLESDHFSETKKMILIE